MKNIKITYNDEYQATPITFWVHQKIERHAEFNIDNFNPPLSKIIGGKGYPLLCLGYLGIELRFSSVEEIEHCIEVLGAKNMQTTISLSLKRNARVGPNGHWLSRLPAKLKSWRRREVLVKKLELAKDQFQAIYYKKANKSLKVVAKQK
jgi:hypothetical protein